MLNIHTKLLIYSSSHTYYDGCNVNYVMESSLFQGTHKIISRMIIHNALFSMFQILFETPSENSFFNTSENWNKSCGFVNDFVFSVQQTNNAFILHLGNNFCKSFHKFFSLDTVIFLLNLYISNTFFFFFFFEWNFFQRAFFSNLFPSFAIKNHKNFQAKGLIS